MKKTTAPSPLNLTLQGRNLCFHYILTCMGPKIDLVFMEKVFNLLSKRKISVCKSKRLAERESDCIEMILSSVVAYDPVALTKTCADLSEEYNVDMIVQNADAYFLEKQLVVLDNDSTLVAAEVIDELAKEALVGDRVMKITQRAMNGEIPFKEALRERVRLLKGMHTSTLDNVHKRIAYTPGAFTLTTVLRKRGCKTAVLTGGFDFFAARVQKELKLDYMFANRLEIKNNKVTGEVLGEIVDGQRKLALMEEIARKEGIPLERVVAVGDGANDLPMITKAGLGIAFNAKPSVRKVAPYNITQKSLTTILYLFGLSEGEILQR